jgi:hypothetical protein
VLARSPNETVSLLLPTEWWLRSRLSISLLHLYYYFHVSVSSALGDSLEELLLGKFLGEIFTVRKSVEVLLPLSLKRFSLPYVESPSDNAVGESLGELLLKELLG